ncbi:MAG: TIGR04282 family arsenosugar biosynthesis glycosyltransferase, partial [Halioglobus sp.]|nr:TIGR04282 family arsenosugar biosynthesis glycosyltransferase [Halioglobus sp.]
MAADRDGCLLIQFAREPVAGAVKTRMIPQLTPQQACDLHSELVLWTAGRLAAARLGRVELAVAGDRGHALFQRCLGLGVAGLSAQRGADLGERMHNALLDGLTRFERVLLVGSDCPGIDRAYLVQALAALEQAEVVLGRAEDGGYVLIGARRVC